MRTFYIAVVTIEGGEERTGERRYSKADALQDLRELKAEYENTRYERVETYEYNAWGF